MDAEKESVGDLKEGVFCRDCLKSASSPVRQATHRSGQCSDHYSEYRRYVKRMSARKKSHETRGGGKSVDEPFQPSRLESVQHQQELLERPLGEHVVAVLERALDAEAEARASLHGSHEEAVRVAANKLLLSQAELVDAIVRVRSLSPAALESQD